MPLVLCNNLSLHKTKMQRNRYMIETQFFNCKWILFWWFTLFSFEANYTLFGVKFQASTCAGLKRVTNIRYEYMYVVNDEKLCQYILSFLKAASEDWVPLVQSGLPETIWIYSFSLIWVGFLIFQNGPDGVLSLSWNNLDLFWSFKRWEHMTIKW